MTNLHETIDQRVYHELKVVAGCLSDATLATVIRELAGWTGRPLMAQKAFLEWQADREFALNGGVVNGQRVNQDELVGVWG